MACTVCNVLILYILGASICSLVWIYLMHFLGIQNPMVWLTVFPNTVFLDDINKYPSTHLCAYASHLHVIQSSKSRIVGSNIFPRILSKHQFKCWIWITFNFFLSAYCHYTLTWISLLTIPCCINHQEKQLCITFFQVLLKMSIFAH